MTLMGSNRPHPRKRTGVRFVLTNAADRSRADDYSAWYDSYESAIICPGLIANATYVRVSDVLEPRPGADGVRQRSSHPFVLVAAH